MKIKLKSLGYFVKVTEGEQENIMYNFLSPKILNLLKIDLVKWGKGEEVEVDKDAFYDALINNKIVFSTWIANKGNRSFYIEIPYSYDLSIVELFLDAFEKDKLVEIEFRTPFLTENNEFVSEDKLVHRGYISISEDNKFILKYNIEDMQGYLIDIDNVKKAKIL